MSVREIIAINIVIIALVIAGAVVMNRQRDGPIVLPFVAKHCVDPAIPQRVYIDL